MVPGQSITTLKQIYPFFEKADELSEVARDSERALTAETLAIGKPVFDTLTMSLRAFGAVIKTAGIENIAAKNDFLNYKKAEAGLIQDATKIKSLENFLYFASSLESDPRFKGSRFSELCAENYVGAAIWASEEVSLEDKISISSFVLVQNLTFLESRSINLSRLQFDGEIPVPAISCEIFGRLSFILAARLSSGKYAVALEKGLSAAKTMLSREPKLRVESGFLAAECEGLRAEGAAWESADMLCNAVNIALESLAKTDGDAVAGERAFYDQVEQLLTGGKSSFKTIRENLGQIRVEEKFKELKKDHRGFYMLAAGLYTAGYRQVAIQRPDFIQDFKGAGDLILAGKKNIFHKLLSIDVKSLDAANFASAFGENSEVPADLIFATPFTMESNAEAKEFVDIKVPTETAQRFLKNSGEKTILLMRVNDRHLRDTAEGGVQIKVLKPTERRPIVQTVEKGRNPLSSPAASLADLQGLSYATMRSLRSKEIIG